ncbi:MAG: hypothetical protein QOH71_504 [Blastocatellia bacterium]|jgi:tetrahydromethanopterin S-methyltransferase subunit F|nr:hypothetical protein [Blastocatellia bacterium]
MPMSNFEIEVKNNRRRQMLTALVDEVPSESQIISGLARLASGLEASIFKP